MLQTEGTVHAKAQSWHRTGLSGTKCWGHGVKRQIIERWAGEPTTGLLRP